MGAFFWLSAINGARAFIKHGEYTIPTTVRQYARPVILEISKSIRSPGHYFFILVRRPSVIPFDFEKRHISQ